MNYCLQFEFAQISHSRGNMLPRRAGQEPNVAYMLKSEKVFFSRCPQHIRMYRNIIKILLSPAFFSHSILLRFEQHENQWISALFDLSYTNVAHARLSIQLYIWSLASSFVNRDKHPSPPHPAHRLLIFVNKLLCSQTVLCYINNVIINFSSLNFY